MTETRRYWAFLSYSHVDEAWSQRVHRALEAYRVPVPLRPDRVPPGLRATRIAPVFRDRDELAASPELTREIGDALSAAEALIVLCSPAAARSRWVDEEIRTFQRLGRGDRVFAVVVAGDPLAPPGTEHACFPPALVGGDRPGARREPLAVDLRPGRDTLRDGLLKLVAGLLRLQYDSLRNRDARRRQRRLVALTASSALVAAVMAALAIWALDNRSVALAREHDAQKRLARLHEERARQLLMEEAALEAVPDLVAAASVVEQSASLRVLLEHAAERVERVRSHVGPFSAPVESARVLDGGGALLVRTQDSRAHLVDPAGRRRAVSAYVSNTFRVDAAVASDDGSRLVTLLPKPEAPHNHRAAVIYAAPQPEVRTLERPAEMEEWRWDVAWVAVDPTGRHVVGEETRTALWGWDTAPDGDAAPRRLLDLDGARVVKVRVHSDGRVRVVSSKPDCVQLHVVTPGGDGPVWSATLEGVRPEGVREVLDPTRNEWLAAVRQPDGAAVLLACDLDTGSETRTVVESAGTSSAQALALASDGAHLALAFGATARVLARGRSVWEPDPAWQPVAVPDRVEDLSWDREGRVLVARDSSVFTIARSGVEPQSLRTGVSGAGGCAISPDARRIVVQEDQLTLRVLDPSSPAIGMALRPHAEEITFVAFAEDGRTLLTGARDATVRALDLSIPSRVARVDLDARFEATYPPDVAGRAMSRALISCDGRRVCWLSHEWHDGDAVPAARVFDVETWRDVCSLRLPPSWQPQAVLSPDGHHLAWVKGGGLAPPDEIPADVQVLRLSEPVETESFTLTLEEGIPIALVGFTADGRGLLVRDAPSRLSRLDLESHRIEPLLDVPDLATFELLPGSRDLVTVDSAALRIWRLDAAGRGTTPAGEIPRAGTDPVRIVTASDDHRFLAALGSGAIAVDAEAQRITDLDVSETLTAVAFDPTTGSPLLGAMTGRVSILDAATGRATRVLERPLPVKSHALLRLPAIMLPGASAQTVLGIASALQGKVIVTVDSDDTLRVFDPQDGSLIFSERLPYSAGYSSALVLGESPLRMWTRGSAQEELLMLSLASGILEHRRLARPEPWSAEDLAALGR